MTKTQINLDNGHTLYAYNCSRSALPENCEYCDDYGQFYHVPTPWGQNWWMAKGHKNAPKQIVVWYPNGKMWLSYGITLKSALEGAIADAWQGFN